MLWSARVTAFTVSELLRENQEGLKLPPHSDKGSIEGFWEQSLKVSATHTLTF